MKLKKKHDIDPYMIKEIIIRVNKQAYSASAEPIETKRRPRNIVNAQFSIPYTVACALMYGRVDIRNFTEKAIKRKDILNIADKVTPVIDEEIEKKYGRVISSAILNVKLC